MTESIKETKANIVFSRMTKYFASLLFIGYMSDEREKMNKLFKVDTSDDSSNSYKNIALNIITVILLEIPFSIFEGLLEKREILMGWSSEKK